MDDQRYHDERFIAQQRRSLDDAMIKAEEKLREEGVVDVSELVRNRYYVLGESIAKHCADNGISLMDWYMENDYDDADVEHRFVMDIASYIYNIYKGES